MTARPAPLVFVLSAGAAISAILLLPPWSFSFDIVPKIVVILAAAALVFVLPYKRPDIMRDPAAKPLRYFAIILAAQAVITIIAAIFSTHPRFSWIGSTWRRSGVIAEIAVLVVAAAVAGQLEADNHLADDLAANRRSLRILLRVTVLASLPISIYGILQYFGVDPILAAAGYQFGEGTFMIVRPPSTLGHAAYFATYLLYVAFAGAALIGAETVRSWKIAATAASVLAIFAMVLSGTRAALLGFILGVMFVVLRERTVFRERWRFLVITAAIAVVIGAFYLAPAGERLRARAFWAGEDRLGGSRLLLWRDTLGMIFKESPAGRWLAGYGPETFAVEFPRHESLSLARAFPDFYHESPHNIFLDALVSTGILGLAARIALVLLCLARARGPMGGAFVAMLISLQFTTFTLPTELYFYLTAAILVSVRASDAVPSARQDASVEQSRFPPSRGRDVRVGRGRSLPSERWVAWRPLRWIFAIPFLATAVYLATGDAVLAATRNALDRGDADRAAQLEDRARRWNAAADVYFSRRFLALNGSYSSNPNPSSNPNRAPADAVARFRVWQYAMAAASHAPETADDRQNALLNLAALESANNDAAGVERTLREAIEAAPMYFKSRWLLAEVLELEGRTAEARAEAQAAFDRDGGKHAEVAATWERLRTR
jgi:O-antigen ligase